MEFLARKDQRTKTRVVYAQMPVEEYLDSRRGLRPICLQGAGKHEHTLASAGHLDGALLPTIRSLMTRTRSRVARLFDKRDDQAWPLSFPKRAT